MFEIKKSQKRTAPSRAEGFTLIEILIVIGLISILATIVVVAINPARQFAQARNTQRISNINTILNAIGQNIADNKGIFTCPNIGESISQVAIHIGTAPGLANLGTCLVPTYIPFAIPTDPLSGTAIDTQYTIMLDPNVRYTICAPNGAESAIQGSAPICLTR